MSFVHLHTHTHYTLQRALGDPERLAKRAKELSQSAIAITDAGNLYGAFEFYRACKDVGVKPIIGVEFQISKKGRFNKEKDNELYEIVLLAKNNRGYQNLIQLVTISQIEGFWNGRPRIDFDLLEEYSFDIIALSGSMYGEIGQHIITGKEDQYIHDRIAYYEKVFGRDHFYLELQEHPDRAMQPKINEKILELAKNHGYNYVGTNNSYYISPDDAEIQDMMSSVADGRELDDPDRSTLMNGDYSIRSSREMEELFIYAPEACINTSKIADMIDIEIDYGKYKIPVFPLSESERIQHEKYSESLVGTGYKPLTSEEWLLRTLCIQGLNFRYEFGLTEEQVYILLHKIAIPENNKNLSSMSVEELYTRAELFYSEDKVKLIALLDQRKQGIIRRLEYELTVVDMMGFNGYFCIVADFIGYAKSHGIPVGPGRGSAAGAILAYLSGITDIDPLKYGLLFERFLNPARVTMPDIDVDFSDEGRDKVLEYVRKKYGSDHVAQVCTFGTLAARAAVKDAGKALGIPFQAMNDFAKLIPARPGITIDDALLESLELKKAYDSDARYAKVIDSAKKFEGTVRQLGVHACAVIIAPEPITCFCPLQPPPKDPTTTVTQFSAGPLESLGLLKMDFLGLRNLAILDRAVKIVEEVHDVRVDLLKIDYEDQKVLALFGEGDMTGVFQFESSGMRRYLKELKPSSFEDLIAMVSLYRPGPLQYIPEFIDRKFGRKVVEYPHPSLESILKPTYGIAVYQEQIMQLVQAFAGFSLGEADILRRAIGKKKYELLMEQRGKFIDAAIKEGHPEELAIYIFDEIIEPFAGYGFNKSHAACYSMIAYQTAYMKSYYPTEFMTALLISDEEDTDRINMEIEEAGMKGVKILPPDINQSMSHFTFIDSHNIRFGLKAIKGLGNGPIETIRGATKEKKFEHIEDFIARTGSDVVNKKSLESLIYSGALDAFGERNSLLASIPKMTAYLKEIEAKEETQQMGLFDSMEDASSGVHFELVRVEPMTFEERMKGEKMVIGYPVSGHPLEGIEEFVRKKSKNLGPIFDWIEKQHNIDTPDDSVSGANNLPIVDTVDILTNNSLDSLIGEEDIPQVEENRDTSAILLDKKKEPEEAVYATLIGLVHEVRKIQTKSGGMMLMAKIQSVGFYFRLIIFSREYETYVTKIEEDTIIVVDGRIRFDNERDEISISPGGGFGKKGASRSDAVKTFSISQFREFAKNSGVLHENVDKDSQKEDPRFFVEVPSYWTKDDLLDLRDYLEKCTTGLHPVWIRVNGAEKDTKFTIADIAELESWIGERGI